MRRNGENDAPPRSEVAPYPALTHAAGLIWVVAGGLEVLHTAAWYALVGENRIVGVPVGCFPSGPAAGWCTGLVGLPYLVVGCRVLTGRAGDARGYGVLSILLGMVQVTGSIVYGLAGANAQHENVPGGLIALSAAMGVLGTVLVVAGAFALASRSAYLEWRRAQRVAGIRGRRK